MGPASFVKSDSFLSPTSHSLFSFFFSFFFFLLHFPFFISSSLSVLLFVLLQSKISPTLKDKRISALLIHSFSSLICLSFFVLHPSHADPSLFVLHPSNIDPSDDQALECTFSQYSDILVVDPKEEKRDLWNECVCVCRRSSFVGFVFWLKWLYERWVSLFFYIGFFF